MKYKGILEKIFWTLSQIKLSHWQENSGYKHLVLDNFYKDLAKEFDRFVETLQGADNTHLVISDELFRIQNEIDYEVLGKEIYKFLDELRKKFEDRKYLVNIIDDIDTIVNRNLDLLRKS